MENITTMHGIITTGNSEVLKEDVGSPNVNYEQREKCALNKKQAKKTRQKCYGLLNHRYCDK